MDSALLNPFYARRQLLVKESDDSDEPGDSFWYRTQLIGQSPTQSIICQETGLGICSSVFERNSDSLVFGKRKSEREIHS